MARAERLERWNTHFDTCVEVEVLGVKLRLAQDPSSENLGTTVWDASIVMAKYFEKNIRKGDFSRAKVRGKRAIDLGAGMGLGGLAFALLGADVVLTDLAPVLPLLRRNTDNNLSPAALKAASGDGACAEAAGRVSVAELDWSNPSHWAGGGEGGAGVVAPPFDYVLASDCIYHEKLVRALYRTLLAVTGERSVVLIANERRSESVQSAFTSLFAPSFTFKKIQTAKMAEGYSHPAIELTILKRRKDASAANLDALEAEEAAAAEAAAAAAAEAEAAGPPAEAAAAAAAASEPAGAGPPAKAAAAAAGAGAAGAAAAAAAAGGPAAAEPASAAEQEETGAAEEVTAEAREAAAVAEGLGAATSVAAAVAGTAGATTRAGDGHGSSTTTTKSSSTAPKSSSSRGVDAPMAVAATAAELAGQLAASLGAAGPPSFQARRAGAMAARLLAGVEVPKQGAGQPGG